MQLHDTGLMILTRLPLTFFSIETHMKNVEHLLNRANIFINLHYIFNISDNIKITFFLPAGLSFCTPGMEQKRKERKDVYWTNFLRNSEATQYEVLVHLTLPFPAKQF